MEMTGVLIVLCVMLGIFWLFRQKRASQNEPPMLPGSLPLLGHAHLFIGDCCYLWRLLCKWGDTCTSLGGVVSVALGPKTIYDPDDALTVANACLTKDRIYTFGKPWFGNGLLTARYPVWKNHRKLIQPAFSPTVLEGFVGVFNGQARKLVQNLEPRVGKGVFNVLPYTKHNSLETICLTAFGVDFNDQTVLNNEYVEAVEDFINILIERFQTFWLYHPRVYKISSLKKKQDACLKILHNMSKSVLNRKKLAMNNSKPIMDISNETEPGIKMKCKPFMDLLLELNTEKVVFTDEEIRAHADTMIAAGHETSANVIMYTLMLLGSHPEVQEKVYAELQEVLGNEDRDVEKADLSKLVYLEAVLKETMRYYTILPATARWLHRDVKLKNCTLSAGRTCVIVISAIHRHPVWGDDANQFKPERWLDPSTLPDSPNAFAAFMLGRRTCIGKSYAYMSMKITMSHLLRRYRVHFDDSNLVLKMEVFLNPSSGHLISIEDR